MSKFKSKELKVGAMVVIAFALLYVGLRFLKGINFFSSSRTYYAVYENVDGLVASNPVMVNGLNVGMVSHIDIMHDEGNKLKVELLIKNDVAIGPKTVAELSSNGLLGSKVINLNIEPNITQPLEDGSRVLSMADKPFTALVADQAAPLVEKLDKLMTDFQGSGAEAKNMMHSFTKTSSSVDSLIVANQVKITQLVGNLAQTTYLLNRSLADLQPTLENLNKLSTDMAKTDLSKTVEALDKNLASLQAVLDNVNNGNGSMGKLMKDEQLYNNVNHTVQSMDSLLMDLKAHPKRYVHFSVFGKKDKAPKEVKSAVDTEAAE
ncbi:MlaD family protein [Persicobacter psychrovividus]|uniref:Organic solvent ABC transporter substrate-binding protein n=1 Tax=Persicobacter psychrovividus TaxID=387638 RepID=A0ABM7VBQ8_9BACT|nr:organic solvent ABC transporter substrate-binding protein [Persicobacter psychrovividus]